MSEEQDPLATSLNQIGQIRSAFVCQQHPERTLSGRHRIRKGYTRRAQYDVEALAKKLNLPHEFVEWLVTTHDNIQREVSQEEREIEVRHMAGILEGTGVKPEDIAVTLAKYLPFSEQYIRRLLPSEFKHVEKARVQEESAKLVSQIPEQAASIPAQSPSMKQNLVSQHTPAQQLLDSAFSYYGLHPDMDYTEFIRDGELTKEGKQKVYRPDYYFKQHKLVVEVEGEGSASSDNEERDKFFTEKGFRIIHLSNKLIEKHSSEVAQIFAVLLK